MKYKFIPFSPWLLKSPVKMMRAPKQPQTLRSHGLSICRAISGEVSTPTGMLYDRGLNIFSILFWGVPSSNYSILGPKTLF